ncbi:IS21 family transposase [Laribacter hongkongensis]|uniref:IS21 family transposase n=1 Tax=Laribacter hongkongensis TaxID=168471 RepID=UPI001EFE8230|nr:IS21 family transposase [Laribacter hongkongensis]MCG9066264.1 IS21 family transposase [Laribacter hongkongensis]
MNKLHDIVRLIMTTSLSDRDIAFSLGVSKTTIGRYRALVLEHGYDWPNLQHLSEYQLDALFNKRLRGLYLRRMPDFANVHEELQTKGVTLALLWEEYRSAAPTDSLSYSQFTYHYREYRQSIDRSMRQSHRPGEKCFVDFSGKKPSYINSKTQEVVTVELFVGVLGFSNYSFALGVPTQTVIDWLEAHIRMFEYFGGVSLLVIPDNLKAAVVKAGASPYLNRMYRDFAAHYDFGILPARKYHPKDKAKAEQGVQHLQRWILARLRYRQFFSLEELNHAIAELLEDVNQRPFKKMIGSRKSRFEAFEKPALHPLPVQRYEWAEWCAEQRVGPDYHVCVKAHWYSVPHQLVRERVEARITAHSVEIFHQARRIAAHARDDTPGAATTDPNHMPPEHRGYAERTPENYLNWASKIGPNTSAIVQQQLAGKAPILGFTACDQLRKLARQYGEVELELAALRAVQIQSLTVKSVRSLLSTGRHRHDFDMQRRQGSLPLHHNVRGADYYSSVPENSTLQSGEENDDVA